MAKDKQANPVTAHAKAQKRAEHKKTKAAVAAQRTERLAKRNPQRLEKQIAELKDLETAGQLRPKDKETLKTLERDLTNVKKAREKAGVPERDYGGAARDGQRDRDRDRGGDARRGDRRDGYLGRDGEGRPAKRRRFDDDEDDSEDTDPEVRAIPMPRDTPPPVPRRRPRGGRDGEAGGREERREQAKPQLTYSSAPVLRDLRKEATSKFAPSVVRRNIEKVKGKGGLVEEEEWERLERAGYGGGRGRDGAGREGSVEQVAGTAETAENAEQERGQDSNGRSGQSRGVMMEEVEDEGT